MSLNLLEPQVVHCEMMMMLMALPALLASQVGGKGKS